MLFCGLLQYLLYVFFHHPTDKQNISHLTCTCTYACTCRCTYTHTCICILYILTVLTCPTLGLKAFGFLSRQA